MVHARFCYENGRNNYPHNVISLHALKDPPSSQWLTDSPLSLLVSHYIIESINFSFIPSFNLLRTPAKMLSPSISLAPQHRDEITDHLSPPPFQTMSLKMIQFFLSSLFVSSSPPPAAAMILPVLFVLLCSHSL